MVLVWILGSTFLVTLISLVGIFTLSLNEKLMRGLLYYFVSFSAGALIGGAFLHLLPEALEKTGSEIVFYSLISGFILFFLLERYFCWRHCHDETCNVHAFTYLSLAGDSLHNFIDGLVIAASFMVSVKLGIVTTLAVILHEIPQELGDFGVLVYGGFSKKKALFYNFISAFTAMIGAVTGYFISAVASGYSIYIVPLTAGGFIYIAASDLIPQIHKERDLRRSNIALIVFLSGIFFMGVARKLLAHYA